MKTAAEVQKELEETGFVDVTDFAPNGSPLGSLLGKDDQGTFGMVSGWIMAIPSGKGVRAFLAPHPEHGAFPGRMEAVHSACPRGSKLQFQITPRSGMLLRDFIAARRARRARERSENSAAS